jgi:hypothetical protein
VGNILLKKLCTPETLALAGVGYSSQEGWQQFTID